MANEKGPGSDGFDGKNVPGDRGEPGEPHLTGSDRIDSSKPVDGSTGSKGAGAAKGAAAAGATAAGATAASRKADTGGAETYRPTSDTSRAGATASERVAPKKGFNPAWLLVPAAGLLLGGLGIANMNREPSSTPTVAATPADSDVQTVAPVATTGTASVPASEVPPTAANDNCKISFTGTRIENAIPRMKNVATGQWYYPPSGKEFVVVNTTIGNRGTDVCWASPAEQRGYTAATTYSGGNKAAGDQLYRGRRMNKSFAPEMSTTGAFVFVVPKGSQLTQVGLRQNGASKWTIVRK